MAIYITSDCHFQHVNILKYEPDSRPFDSVEEMDETIIRNWNDKITPNDTVYVLGDFSMGLIDNAIPLIQRLNGKIILVRGNHDTEKRIEKYKEIGIEVKDIAYLTYKGRFFVMCHFPIASKEFMNMVRNDNSEVVCLYGHVHHNAPRGFVDGTFHVGLDTNDLKPWSIQEIWEMCWPAEQLAQPEIAEYKRAHEMD